MPPPRVGAEDLALIPPIGLRGPAPGYWKRVHTPPAAPGGRPVPREEGVRTLQEALTRVASGRSGIPLCGATAEDDRRGDIAFVPVSGLADSALALVWPRGKGTAELQDLAPVLTVCDR